MTAKARTSVYRCFDCNLPDPYDGAGDGIGSCECPRCPDCGWPPGTCDCADDEWPYTYPGGDYD